MVYPVFPSEIAARLTDNVLKDDASAVSIEFVPTALCLFTITPITHLFVPNTEIRLSKSVVACANRETIVIIGTVVLAGAVDANASMVGRVKIVLDLWLRLLTEVTVRLLILSLSRLLFGLRRFSIS